MISQTVTVEELRTEDLRNLTMDQLRDHNEFRMTVEDWENKQGVYRLSAKEDMNIHLRGVAYGAASTEYRLVVFMDNVPIAIADENLPVLQYGESEKIIIDTVVDLAGFDGSSLVYSVLVPRSSVDATFQHASSVRAWASTGYYFSSLDTWEELLGK